MLKMVAITIGISSAYLTKNSGQIVRLLLDTLS
jgi:hypothetical protein